MSAAHVIASGGRPAPPLFRLLFLPPGAVPRPLHGPVVQEALNQLPLVGGHGIRQVEHPPLPVVGEGLVDEARQVVQGYVEVPGDADLDLVIGLAPPLFIRGNGVVGNVDFLSQLLLGNGVLPAQRRDPFT